MTTQKQDAFDRLLNFLFPPKRDSKKDSAKNLSMPTTQLKPKKVRQVVVPQSTSNRVFRKIRSLKEEKGWVKKGDGYEGFYRTPYASYQGKIDNPYKGKFTFWIYNPPECLKDHSHHQCFWPKGKGGKHEVHFKHQAISADDGIVSIEKILAEAHQIEQQKKLRR